MAAGIWNLGSHNCGLSIFAHGEARDPGGTEVARLDLPQLDGAAVGSAVTTRGGSSGETCHCSLTIAPGGGATGPSSSGSSVSRIQALEPAAHLLQHLGAAGSAARLLPSAGSRTRS